MKKNIYFDKRSGECDIVRTLYERGKTRKPKLFTADERKTNLPDMRKRIPQGTHESEVLQS